MSHLFDYTSTPLNNSTVFGEVQTSYLRPLIQLDSLTDINKNQNFKVDACNGGSCYSSPEGLITVESGTQANAFAAARTARTIRYRAGQGSICRFTCAWPDGGALGYYQFAGFLRLAGCVAVGYGPTGEFGALISRNALSQVWELTVTNATDGAESITVTLNDIPYTLDLPGGFSIKQLASHIAYHDKQWEADGWQSDVVEDKIVFTYVAYSEPLSGSFSVVNNTPGGTFAASSATLQVGRQRENNFTPQTAFNLDKLDGTGPSGMILDPTKLNVFQIDFRWLGVGQIRWAIEDQATGAVIPYHILHYTNQHNVPHVSDPTLRVGLVIANLEPEVGTGTSVRMQSGSMMGGNQGPVVYTLSNQTARTAKTGTYAKEQYHHVLTIKNDLLNYAGVVDKANYREISLLRLDASVSVSSGTRPVRLLVFKNGELEVNTDHEWTSLGNYTSVSQADELFDATTGTIVADFGVSPSTPAAVDLDSLRLLLTRGEILSFVMYSPVSNMSSIDLSVMLIED